ncbi:MAG: hypothetical protein QW597_07100 [Thermoplasmataceae archaeon]
MRKKIALIGLAIFVVGIVLVGVSLAGTFSLTHTNGTVNIVTTGEWDSGEINVSSGGLLTVTTSASTNYGLVKAADLSSVSPTTLSSIAVKSNTSTSAASHQILTYQGLNGSYYFVVFASSTPSILIAYITDFSQEIVYALILLPGGAMAVIGFIVGIVGVILKKKP